MPTLLPTQNCVPRWRTTMVPHRTNSPSVRLTPSRLALLSRPLRELPTPFLWAISNLSSGSGVDAGDGQFGQLLPVTDLAAIPLLRLVLEDVDLLAAKVILDVCRDRSAIDDRRADRGRASSAEEQDAIERNFAAGIGVKALDANAIANLDAILLSACLNNGVTVSRGRIFLLRPRAGLLLGRLGRYLGFVFGHLLVSKSTHKMASSQQKRAPRSHKLK